MSIKSKMLDVLLAGMPPANTYNFLVIIGRLKLSLVSAYASKATWPSQKRPSLQVSHKGKNFIIPAHTEESSGILNIGFHENVGFYVREQLRMIINDTDNPMGLSYFDIYLISLSASLTPIALTVFSHCWLSERSTLSLSHDQTTVPASWDASFIYNGVKEESLIPSTPAIAMIAAEAAIILGEKASV